MPQKQWIFPVLPLFYRQTHALSSFEQHTNERRVLYAQELFSSSLQHKHNMKMIKWNKNTNLQRWKWKWKSSNIYITVGIFLLLCFPFFCVSTGFLRISNKYKQKMTLIYIVIKGITNFPHICESFVIPIGEYFHFINLVKITFFLCNLKQFLKKKNWDYLRYSEMYIFYDSCHIENNA